MLPSVLSRESEDFFPGSPFVHHSNARYSGTFHCCLLESFQVGEEKTPGLQSFPGHLYSWLVVVTELSRSVLCDLLTVFSCDERFGICTTVMASQL